MNWRHENTFPMSIKYCDSMAFFFPNNNIRRVASVSKAKRQIMSLWSVSRRKRDRPRMCHVTGRRATFKSCTCTHTYVRTCHKERERRINREGRREKKERPLTLGKVKLALWKIHQRAHFTYHRHVRRFILPLKTVVR